MDRIFCQRSGRDQSHKPLDDVHCRPNVGNRESSRSKYEDTLASELPIPIILLREKVVSDLITEKFACEIRIDAANVESAVKLRGTNRNIFKPDSGGNFIEHSLGPNGQMRQRQRQQG